MCMRPTKGKVFLFAGHSLKYCYLALAEVAGKSFTIAWQ